LKKYENSKFNHLFIKTFFFTAHASSADVSASLPLMPVLQMFLKNEAE